MTHMRLLTTAAAVAACATLALSAQDPAQPPPPRQPSEIVLTINGAPGLPPKFAVPDFIALSSDAGDRRRREDHRRRCCGTT